MSLALTVQNVHHDFRTKRLYIIATPSGNYTTGGDTLDLTAIVPSLGQSNAQIGYPGTIRNFEIISNPAGYPTPTIVRGTTLKTWKLKVYSAIDTELAAGAYPADILSGTFVLMFEGPKFQM